MGFKCDIQATRSNAAPGATAIVAPSIRLRAISVASDGGGAGVLSLSTGSSTGTVLLTVDVPDTDVYTLNLPEDGIVFPQGIYCHTKTHITAYTVFTDKYSGSGLVSQQP